MFLHSGFFFTFGVMELHVLPRHYLGWINTVDLLDCRRLQFKAFNQLEATMRKHKEDCYLLLYKMLMKDRHPITGEQLDTE